MASYSQRLNRELERWDFFGECILWDLHSTHFGYGLSLAINYVWDADGRIRDDVLQNPLLYVFQFLGVDSIRLVAGLTSGMKADPGMIDWGFAEAARVDAFESAAGCGLSIRWEAARRLDIEFSDYMLLSPEGHPL